jgi:hypothetical protein
VGTLRAFLGYPGDLFGPLQGLIGVYQTRKRHQLRVGALRDEVAAAQHAVAIGFYDGRQTVGR